MVVSAQEYLDTHYPLENRSNIKKVDGISFNPGGHRNSGGPLKLKGFVNLTELMCLQSLLTDLDLSDCTKLEKLQCSGNHLTKLDLSTCFELKNLFCCGNRFSSLDFLNQFPNPEKLT